MPDTDRICHHCEELLETDHEYDQYYHDACIVQGTPWNKWEDNRNDKPQGVAQRVIDEYSQLFRDAHAKGTYPEMKYNAEAIDALHRMHKAMSAEARRVLRIYERPRSDYEHDAVTHLANCLGLDLNEPEDNDE